MRRWVTHPDMGETTWAPKWGKQGSRGSKNKKKNKTNNTNTKPQKTKHHKPHHKAKKQRYLASGKKGGILQGRKARYRIVKRSGTRQRWKGGDSSKGGKIQHACQGQRGTRGKSKRARESSARYASSQKSPNVGGKKRKKKADKKEAAGF